MSRRGGFTLVELFVVIMILGILAAVAVPKMVVTTNTATDNSLRQSLSVVRDAIEMYAAQNTGKLPGDNFETEIRTYLRGGLPVCPVGAKNALVEICNVDPDADGFIATGDTSKAWRYNKKDGQFIANTNDDSNEKDAAGTAIPYAKF